jgi:[ribosomal protein S18]-alanine N-acetyltransferase
MIAIIDGDARDIAGIMPIMQGAFDPFYGEAWTAAQCLSLLSLPASQLVIAQCEGIFIGFAMSRWVLDEEELLMIGVAKDKQRTKIGSILLQHIVDRARAQQRRKLFLEVRSSNPARSFYENKGFVSSGIRKQYYLGADGSQHDAITMTFML